MVSDVDFVIVAMIALMVLLFVAGARGGVSRFSGQVIAAMD